MKCMWEDRGQLPPSRALSSSRPRECSSDLSRKVTVSSNSKKGANTEHATVSAVHLEILLQFQMACRRRRHF